MRNRFLTAVWVAFSSLCSMAYSAELVRIERPSAERLVSRAFTLDRGQAVRISGVTLAYHEWLPARIWMLDARTRKVVWDVAKSDLKDNRRRTARFDDSVQLQAGEYELYLAVFPNFFLNNGEFSLGRLIDGIFHSGNWDDSDSRLERMEVRVTGDGTAQGEVSESRVRKLIAERAVVAFVGVGDDAELRGGFTLTAPADLHVTCVGEAQKDGNNDAGWISDADSGATVWRFDYHGSRAAGGASKNRVADTVVHLDAGRYIAHFESDSSHSYPEFNAPPPDDPLAWGLVIRAEKPADAAQIKSSDADKMRDRNVLVSLTQIGNNEHKSAGFTLRRPLDVRIIAVGEGSGKDMADYGMILNAKTRETVWEMRYRDSEHAGGGTKNRIVDRVVHLEAGNYIASFVTDGSHAYGDWNAAPPFDRQRWGITVLAADPKYDANDVSSFDPDRDPNALVRLVRIRDDERRKATLKLDRDADVEIYALGEGEGGDMVDYAYIEDDRTGDTVWEMRYRDTEHAGGARKNRVFRGRVHLAAGTYRVVYESDGSHSYEDWNSAPPKDPESWGITITMADRVPAEAPPSKR